MKDKTGFPRIPNKLVDIQLGGIFIPPGYISVFQLEPGILANNDGTEYGRYGIHLYGRCRYHPGVVAIYGTDTYGNCVYGVASEPGLSSGHAFRGNYENMKFGEAVDFGELCYIASDSKLYLADADSDTTAVALVICVSESVAADGIGKALYSGWVKDTSWSWTPGRLWNSTTAGALSATKAGSGKHSQVVGYAIKATEILFIEKVVIEEA